MKKILLALVVLLAAQQGMRAQVSAIDGILEYQKGQNKRSSIIELPYPPEIVENAIRESMTKKGYKQQKAKGDMLVYRGVQLDNDPEISDLHFKVERKSRQEKAVSNVYLIVGRSSENIALRADNDMYKSEPGKAFLNGLVPAVAAHSLEVNIKDQEEVVKKAEKKLKNLQDDQKDYEKKISNLQDKLEQNKKDQEAQSDEVNKQQATRDAMNARKIVL